MIDSRRGQTLPDFVVGIAIFLITVTFVLQFIPQMLLPYEEQEQPVVAQRIANSLGNQLLTEGTTPSELNETCTLSFFGQGTGEHCPFDPNDTVSDQLGISPTYTVNVTLRDKPGDTPESTLLCERNGSIGECEMGADRLRLGPSVQVQDSSVSIARRRVFVGDTEAVIEVGVE